MNAESKAADWNPYVAGIALGLVLLATFLLMGFGLGGSAGATRIAVAGVDALAPGAIEGSAYLNQYVAGGANPLEDWMVFEVLGVFLGGLLGAYSAGRLRRGHVVRGPTATKTRRLLMALAGGILLGFAARLARGCTSGQALTGGAMLAAGSWVFMMAVFLGGYITAPFTRRQWR